MKAYLENLAGFPAPNYGNKIFPDAVDVDIWIYGPNGNSDHRQIPAKATKQEDYYVFDIPDSLREREQSGWVNYHHKFSTIGGFENILELIRVNFPWTNA